ncbi:MAG TPA: DUF475 domain-containing protein [Thermoleophilaceae bacterium]|nr:DUF475 domain-containing protein [Thermoleophilaceae bacterium]
MKSFLDIFKWSVLATLAALVAAYFYGGLGAIVVVAILIALESSISFDNAVVNATVLRRMSRGWQRAFLTIGILIAVFGMRLFFPVAIVAVATKLGLLEVVHQALNDQDAYAQNVEKAAPIIGSFGGTFLLMVALTFFLEERQERHWIRPVERVLRKLGQVPGLPTAVAASAVVATAQLVPEEATQDVLLSGLVGLIVFLVVRGASDVLERSQAEDGGAAKATGAAGLAAFLYLEMLDASFSLDGVLGAFAISTDIVVIALGLGVGAIYVRSLTVYLVRRETLQRYVYLKHGAHWAIAALAVILFLSVEYHVPEWLTAIVGLGFIGAALTSSLVHNRRAADEH